MSEVRVVDNATLVITGDEPWDTIKAYTNRKAGYVDLEQGDHHVTVTRDQAPLLLAVLGAIVRRTDKP